MIKVTMDNDGDVFLVDRKEALDKDVIGKLKYAGFRCGSYFVSTRYGYPLREVLEILSDHYGGIDMHVLVGTSRLYHRVPSGSEPPNTVSVSAAELVEMVDAYNIDGVCYTVCDSAEGNVVVGELDATTALVLIDALVRSDDDG